MILRYYMHRAVRAPEGDGSGGGGAAAPVAQPPAAQAPAQASPAQAPAAAPVAQPAPAQAPAQKPALKRPAAAAPKPSPVAEQQALNAELRKTLEESRKMVEADRAKRRLEIVREGMVAPLRDDDLELMIPKVDPTTPEGLAALKKWKADRSDLYPAPLVAPRAKAEDLQKRLPPRLSKSVLFGAESFKRAHEAMRVRRLD